MLDIDDPVADAPAMATPVATPVPKPRRSRSRPEDRPLITDDYVREIIANRDQLDLPNVVRDGTAAGTLGFAFRRSRRDFVVRYTTRGGIERLYPIGPWPRWNTERARRRANEVLTEVDRGGDPMGDQHARRKAPTVAELIVTFIADHVPSLAHTTQTAYRQQLRDYIEPAIGRKRVDDVTHADAIAAINKITRASNRPLANRVQGLGHTLFEFARRLGVRTKPNPFSDVRRSKEHPRHRYLDEDELGRLLGALAEERHDPDGARVVKLLLTCGARRNEVLDMKWADLDLSKAKWSKPATSVKQARAHFAPLNALAIKLLTEIRSEQLAGHKRLGSLVFPPGATFARIGKLQRSWKRLCRRAKLENLRLHDLRHCYASYCASGGASLLVIGELLGHKSAQTTKRYSHLLDSPLREFTEKVGRLIEAAEPTAVAGEILPLRGHRKGMGE
jgi:integrase